MTVVGISPSLAVENIAVPLPRYAQIIGYSESAFFGVAHTDNHEYACRTIWTHWQRMDIYRALQQAQEYIEKAAESGYPFIPTYFTDEEHSLYKPIITDWGKLIKLGKKTIVNTSLNLAVNHATDPATASCAVAFTDVDEVYIYHPGTDFLIIPSKLTIAAGTLSIEIPRVRMVKVALEDTPEQGLDYSDVNNFEGSIDVKRIYADTTDQGDLICHECVSGVATETLTAITGLIRDYDMGIIDIDPCNCAAGLCSCGLPRRKIRLNYLAGAASVTPRMEDAIIRLAHSLLPNAPCGCDFLKEMWLNDQKIPDVLTAERENCPFGMSNGAWIAWTFAQTLKQGIGAVL